MATRYNLEVIPAKQYNRLSILPRHRVSIVNTPTLASGRSEDCRRALAFLQPLRCQKDAQSD